MNRREAARTLLAAPGFPHAARAARRPGDKPNLLFILTDQQRWSTLRSCGNPAFRVPALNRFAEEAVVFRRCYVTQPVCTPARSSLLTGLWPHQNGCVNNNIALPPQFRVFPELLDDSAYQTAYMGKWHLGDEVFAQHGFSQWISIEDTYIRYYSPGRDRGARSSYHHFLLSQGYTPDRPEKIFSREFAASRPLHHTKASFLAQQAASFILGNRKVPWILYVAFLEPHPPYFGPLDELHGEHEAGLPANYPGVGVHREPRIYARLRETRMAALEDKVAWNRDPRPRILDPARWLAALRRMVRHYAGLCTLVDQALQQILWALEVSGQADNTIAVYTSDHGEMGGSHSLTQKGVFYEEAVRVPLILRAPFARLKPLAVDTAVSHIDLVPTLLALMGRKVPDMLPGRSLLDMLRGERPPDPYVVVEWTDVEGGPDGRGVIAQDGWKLVSYKNDHSMLFDRERDPLEMSNLYYDPRHAPVVRRLHASLEDWRARTADRFVPES